ncbi:hypothetical protein GB937_008956 [Aspergillus fischeri]|nr:hypothetical protein GB937_008956 [Aspergillus fischeri]
MAINFDAFNYGEYGIQTKTEQKKDDTFHLINFLIQMASILAAERGRMGPALGCAIYLTGEAKLQEGDDWIADYDNYLPPILGAAVGV